MKAFKNPRVSGYFYIFLASMVSLLNVMDIESFHNEKIMSLSFTAVPTLISFLVIFCERISCIRSRFHVREVNNKNLDGSILGFLCLWWLCGVIYLTKAGGVAFLALNIYLSSWISFFACLYTFNIWLSSKDLVSFKELTRLSPTLFWWYILLFSSVVECGSACDFFIRYRENVRREYGILSVCAGALSVFFSILAILYHYKIIECCKIKPGGTWEFIVALILCIWWILCVALLTRRDGVAATISGQTCKGLVNEGVYNTGSNLYFSLWISLACTIFIMEGWMQAKALKLATKNQNVEIAKDEENFEFSDNEKSTTM